MWNTKCKTPQNISIAIAKKTSIDERSFVYLHWGDKKSCIFRRHRCVSRKWYKIQRSQIRRYRLTQSDQIRHSNSSTRAEASCQPCPNPSGRGSALPIILEPVPKPMPSDVEWPKSTPYITQVASGLFLVNQSRSSAQCREAIAPSKLFGPQYTTIWYSIDQILQGGYIKWVVFFTLPTTSRPYVHRGPHGTNFCNPLYMFMLFDLDEHWRAICLR